MHAATASAPQLGEWYSFEDLFDAYPDNWVLLVFPKELTPEESWDIMRTRGVLIAMDPNKDVVWDVYREYTAEHPGIETFFFATERPDDGIVLIGGAGLYATDNRLDTNSLASAGYSSTRRLAHHSSHAFRRFVLICRRFWCRAFHH